MLYIDGNQNAWFLRLGYEVKGARCTMRCTLLSIFGRFDSSFPSINHQLAEAETILIPFGRLYPLNSFTFERKSDGSEVLIHIYANLNSGNSIDLPQKMSLCEVWLLKLNGSGKVALDGALGDGITATFSRFYAYNELYWKEKKNVAPDFSYYRLGKVNVKEKYEPEEPNPPECNATSYTIEFDLKLIPSDQNFIPFKLDRNKYMQSNWHGKVETETTIVRMLFNENGQIDTFTVKKEKQEVRQIYQSFERKGSAKQENLNYIYKNNRCVLNGNPPALVEEYTGLQVSKVITRKAHEVSILLNDKIQDRQSLIGDSAQQAHTVIGQPVVNSVNVKVILNDKMITDITEKPGVISNQILNAPLQLPNFKIFSESCSIYLYNNNAIYFSRR